METRPVIYISSTFFDLEEHRKVLIDALQKTKSFAVRCMENYGTISKPPLQQCLDDVRTSEFYILLLGNRYGYIPEGYSLSITNLEYKEAIGDHNPDVVATVPATHKCVLPFLLNKDYALSDAVVKAIQDEVNREGAAVTQDKRDKLDKLKVRIGADFTLDKGFTSPQDLVGKVFGALIPELVKRNYASLVNTIQLKDEIIYRCNREEPRRQFLLKNLGKTHYIRAFIIHGESEELPDIFSNNLSQYELKVNRYFVVNSLAKFFSPITQKFFASLALDLHTKIWDAIPDTENFSLEDLVEKLLAANDIGNISVRVQISYKSWQDNSPSLIALFEELQRINTMQSGKSLYLLINLIYRSEEESCESIQPSVMLLDKLKKIDITDIESWVKNYFFLNTDQDSVNKADLLARKICKNYFPDYFDTDECFCMEDAIEVLQTVVNDFNGNKNLFANYTKLYT